MSEPSIAPFGKGTSIGQKPIIPSLVPSVIVVNQPLLSILPETGKGQGGDNS